MNLQVFWNYQKELFEIYPNPTKGRIILDIELPAKTEILIEVYDVLGERFLVKSLIVHKTIQELNLSDLQNGIYLIRFISDQYIVNKRNVITK